MEIVTSVATAVPRVELDPVLPTPSPMWAGTLPGVMAGKRPPKGSPRVDYVIIKGDATHPAVAVPVG